MHEVAIDFIGFNNKNYIKNKIIYSFFAQQSYIITKRLVNKSK